MALVCPNCRGRGVPWKDCNECRGSGQVTYSVDDTGFEGESRRASRQFRCPTCFGKGHVDGPGLCQVCAATGQVKIERRVIPCPNCNGTGQAQKTVGTYPSGLPKHQAILCPACQGQRQVMADVYVPDMNDH